jgi:hypothetical protein
MSEVGAHVTGMETIVKRIVKRVADIETKGNAPLAKRQSPERPRDG